ncbi:MAG: hypothetical protein QGH45_07400, partial [Myxococcota bacterium]|nr:hypothetical protein [Myxococcota bacterium]
MLRKTGAANVAALLLSLTPNPAQADDWWDRRDPVWQGDDAIHANGRAPTRDEAFERARVVLVAALRVGLPELDGELALRSAVLGDLHGQEGDVRARVDFPAAYGEACRSGAAWYRLGLAAREAGRERDAYEGLSHSVWLLPEEPNPLHALGLQLSDDGRWGSAAVVLDAAARGLEEPPLTILREAARTHLYIGDRRGISEAIERLREVDPTDLDLADLEALAARIPQDAEPRLNEKIVMDNTVHSLDAELTARFAAWGLLDDDVRSGLLRSELSCPGVREPAVSDGLALGDLCEANDDDSFSFEDRAGVPWTFSARQAARGSTALEEAASRGVVAPLRKQNSTVWVGGLYPLLPANHRTDADEGWLRMAYYGDNSTPERVRLSILLRWGEDVYELDIDGPLGSEELGWPGMLTAPQMVEV